MNEARVYADGFERSFAEVKDLLEFLAERGRNAKWIRKPTNTLRLAPLEKEAQNLDAADASMEEILEDTEKNTQLVLKMRGESYPVRDCAIRTILSRAGVNGDGLRKLDKATYAKVVNYCLRVAKGDALIKIADGKVSAVHGGDKHDYSLGWKSYGDPEYVPHVLRYYSVGGSFGGFFGNQQIAAIAKNQLGNEGGQKFWSWWEFTERKEWCACFVSWCAEQAGLLQNGTMPRFAYCPDGVD